MNAKSKKVQKIQPDSNNQMVVQSQADKLLEMAISKGTDMDQLEKLLALKERYDKEEARKAFTAALAEFKAENLEIIKDRNVTYETDKGTTSYNHASLGNIIEISTPILSKHGFSHRWETDQGEGNVKVTCVLTHKAGHSERTTLMAGPDSSGGKNSIQAIASSVSYLERYTFLAITGMAVKEQDDDGAMAPTIAVITQEQVANLECLISEVNANEANFLKFCKVDALEDLPESKYSEAIKALEAKR